MPDAGTVVGVGVDELEFDAASLPSVLALSPILGNGISIRPEFSFLSFSD